MTENQSGDGGGRNGDGRRPPSSIRQGVVPDRAPSHAGPSERTPNSQPSSPPFNECEPERKRQKLDVSRTESDAEPSHASAKESAALRFFAVPELLSLVLGHFDYEKTELLILSYVSKRMRANVLPRLVGSLDVPFTKAKDARIFLESTPGLASHVRCLRIWDNVGRHYWNRRPFPQEDWIPQGYRNQIPPTLPEDMWTQLGSLFSLLQDNSRFRLPFVDLYVGVSSIGQLYAQLQQRPRLAEQLTALRLVDDFCPSRHGRPSTSAREMDESIEKHVQRYSEHLEDLLRLICEVQDGAGSQAFQVFGITGSSSAFDGIARVRFLPSLSQKVLVSVAKRVQHLSIVLNQVSSKDVSAYQALLDPNWPQLLTFDVRKDWDQVAPWLDAFEASTHAFCQRHPTLTRAGVEIHEDGVPYWAKVTLPHVTACSLNVDDNEASKTGLDFVLQHEKIERLSLAENQKHADGQIIASHRPLRDSLRFLRAGPYAVQHFLRRDTNLRHVQVMGEEENIPLSHPDIDEDEDLDVSRWFIFPDARQYTSITCVEYNLTHLNLDIILLDMERILPFSQLPNLTEFCVHTGGGFRGDSRDSEDLGALFLAEMLSVLNGCDRLRAVWFGCDGFAELPPDEELNEIVDTLPPRLEYMTWHMPFDPTTRHYRVVRPVPVTEAALSIDSAPDPAPVPTTEGEGRRRSTRPRRPSRKAKEAQTKTKTKMETETRTVKDKQEKPPKALLEKLPASFRPKVDKRTGRWEDMDDERVCKTLFDHMGDQPVLRYA